MKARQTFKLPVDEKGKYVFGVQTDKEITITKGDVVPEEYVKDLIHYFPDYLVLEYEKGNIKLSEEERKKFGFKKEEKVESKPSKVKKEKYDLESLTKIRDEGGRDAIEKICDEMGIRTRYRRTKHLVNNILTKQAENLSKNPYE